MTLGNTYSVPVPLILKREYILIKTMAIAIEVSIQTIAIKDPPLSWSPPLGTGSEAIGMALLRKEAPSDGRNQMCRESNVFRIVLIDSHCPEIQTLFRVRSYKATKAVII